MYDLIVRNGTIVTPGEVYAADLGVEGGLISCVAPHLEGTAREEIDAGGLHLFPGAVDIHVHCNEPGRTEWEGFATATRAMAAGGTTTFFDMPLNSHPPTTDAEAFRLKKVAAEAQCIVDFGLWGGIVPGNLVAMSELAEAGVVGFKAFMSNSGIEDFSAVSDLELYEGMREAAALKLPVAVHAESDNITSGMARRAISEGKTAVRDYLKSRPAIAEWEAITRAVLFAEETGCALHIVHVSTGKGVEIVAEARLRGVDVTCETCPHYLVLTEEDVEHLEAVAKCAPPIRGEADRDALWGHLASGLLPVVATDHSPSPPGMKQAESFFDVWGGISGCQSLLTLMLTEGHEKRKLPIITIAGATSSYGARRFGIRDKGRIEIGADADIAFVELGVQWTLRQGDLLYRHAQSPYIGMNMSARVKRTILRGTTVYLDGKVTGEPHGRLVRPEKVNG